MPRLQLLTLGVEMLELLLEPGLRRRQGPVALLQLPKMALAFVRLLPLDLAEPPQLRLERLQPLVQPSKLGQAVGHLG